MPPPLFLKNVSRLLLFCSSSNRKKKKKKQQHGNRRSSSNTIKSSSSSSSSSNSSTSSSSQEEITFDNDLDTQNENEDHLHQIIVNVEESTSSQKDETLKSIITEDTLEMIEEDDGEEKGEGVIMQQMIREQVNVDEDEDDDESFVPTSIRSIFQEAEQQLEDILQSIIITEEEKEEEKEKNEKDYNYDDGDDDWDQDGECDCDWSVTEIRRPRRNDNSMPLSSFKNVSRVLFGSSSSSKKKKKKKQQQNNRSSSNTIKSSSNKNDDNDNEHNTVLIRRVPSQEVTLESSIAEEVEEGEAEATVDDTDRKIMMMNTLPKHQQQQQRQQPQLIDVDHKMIMKKRQKQKQQEQMQQQQQQQQNTIPTSMTTLTASLTVTPVGKESIVPSKTVVMNTACSTPRSFTKESSRNRRTSVRDMTTIPSSIAISPRQDDHNHNHNSIHDVDDRFDSNLRSIIPIGGRRGDGIVLAGAHTFQRSTTNSTTTIIPRSLLLLGTKTDSFSTRRFDLSFQNNE